MSKHLGFFPFKSLLYNCNMDKLNMVKFKIHFSECQTWVYPNLSDEIEIFCNMLKFLRNVEIFEKCWNFWTF